MKGAQQSPIQDPVLQAKIEVLFPALASLGILIRFSLRHRYKIALRWDDALILISLVFSWGLWGVWYWTTVNLIGDSNTAIRPTTPLLLQKLCLAMDLLYGEGINIVKFAVLVLYLRAFGTDPNAHAIRLTIYSLMGIVAAYTVARGIETAFLCPPTCDGGLKAYSVVAWQFAMRAINWVTEVAILLVPVPILWRMTLPKRTKLGIYMCFVLGVITCVASAGRMVGAIDLYLAQIAISKTAEDQGPSKLQQWFLDYYIPQMSRMTLWGLAELNVGILTATLPAIRSPALAFAKAAATKIKVSLNGSKSSVNDQASLDGGSGHSVLSNVSHDNKSGSDSILIMSTV